MKKGVEILVVDSLTGEIKHRVSETFSFEKGVDPLPDCVKRFESFGRGFCRLLHKEDNVVIQISSRNLPEYSQLGLFNPVSEIRAAYVHFNEMGKNASH